jgi:hypothetical protein
LSNAQPEERALPPEDEDDPISMTDLAGLLASKPEGDNAGDASDAEGEHSAALTNGQGDPGNPDEGTDVEGPEGEGGDGDDGEEAIGDEPSTEPLYTVKIDGKDEQVNLKEALAGYQRHVDYTRKTEEVANARKAVEAEQAQARAARDQYAQVLDVILQRLGPADQEPTAEQWNALRTADPAGYATQWTDYQRREQQRNAVREEQGRIAEQKRGEAVMQARTFIDSERQKLVKALPVFADQEKGPAEMKALREYASKAFNFSDAEIDQAYDHRMILMLAKARQWDNHQAALKKAKGKIENATQIPAPGARQPANVPKAQARKAAQEKFNRTGNIEDAVSLLLR